jgi:hypothetical protein
MNSLYPYPRYFSGLQFSWLLCQKRSRDQDMIPEFDLWIVQQPSGHHTHHLAKGITGRNLNLNLSKS